MNLNRIMNALSTGILVTILVSAMAGIALAEDVSQKGAKVGQEDTFVSWKRDADGFVYENTITCTRVSQRLTKCHTFEGKTLIETMVCDVDNNCRVIARR